MFLFLFLLAGCALQQGDYDELLEVNPKNLELLRGYATDTSELERSDVFKSINNALLEHNLDVNRVTYPDFIQRADDQYFAARVWKDEASPKGEMQLCSAAAYTSNRCIWNTVLDFDRIPLLKERYGANFIVGTSINVVDMARAVFFVYPEGSDERHMFEGDLKTGKIILPEDGGFYLGEKGRHDAAWVDKDHLLVATNAFGLPDTSSGFPASVVLWERGTPITDAKQVFEVTKGDFVGLEYLKDGNGGVIPVITENVGTTSAYYYRLNTKGDAQRINAPLEANLFTLSYDGSSVFVALNAAWQDAAGNNFLQDDVLSISFETGIAELVFRPTAQQSVLFYNGVNTLGDDGVAILTLEDVEARLVHATKTGESWQTRYWPKLPRNGLFWLMHFDTEKQEVVLSYENLKTPVTVSVYNYGTGELRNFKQEKSWIPPEDYTIERIFGTSTDGTKIPAFMVYRKDLVPNGTNRTYINVYGGFGISLWPDYNRSILPWIEKGGIYIVANTRGGSEYGARWHKAGQNRLKVYADVHAVTEAVIKTGLTSPPYIGLRGGSNGGLVACASAMLRPELYGAVMCDAPLLNMVEYHKIGRNTEAGGVETIGQLWLPELGDPDDPVVRRMQYAISPYHMLDCGKTYPPIALSTNETEQRVAYTHVLQFVAAMDKECGKKTTVFLEDNGGHGGGVDPAEYARRRAVKQAWLWRTLGQ